MEKDMTFSYNYSAKENKEVQEIRQRYLPKQESKFDELKRLDKSVQDAGVMEGLCVGITGALILGFGMCLSMQVIGSGVLLMIIGILLGLIGIIIMILAYPIYRTIFNKTKEKIAPRILELTEELSVEKSSF